MRKRNSNPEESRKSSPSGKRPRQSAGSRTFKSDTGKSFKSTDRADKPARRTGKALDQGFTRTRKEPRESGKRDFSARKEGGAPRSSSFGDKKRPFRGDAAGKEGRFPKKEFSKRPYTKREGDNKEGGEGRPSRPFSPKPRGFKSDKPQRSGRYPSQGETKRDFSKARRRDDGGGKDFSKPGEKKRFSKPRAEGEERRPFKPRPEGDSPRRDFSGDRRRDDDREFKPRAERKPRPEGGDEDKRSFSRSRSEGDAPRTFKKPGFGGKSGFAKKGRAVKRTPEPKEENGEIRLNRYISNAGVCSRRDADELITAGMIKVNGNVITEMGYKVKPGDSVKYGNRVLNREKMVYLLLNKPKDFITTTDDPDERKTVMDLVKNACPERVYPVGRLDRATTGLLLLTNDGELAEKLTHPSHQVQKVYQVDLNKPLSDEDYARIMEGVHLEDGVAQVNELGMVNADRLSWGLSIHMGKNRIVRRIFESLGYEVVKLDRVIYAGLTKKDLPRGHYRFLSEKEVLKLKYFI